MKLTIGSLGSAIALSLVTACASAPDEGNEDVTTTTASQVTRCPKPTEDLDGFIACTKRSASGPVADARGGSGNTGENAGNGGTARADESGGTIRIGDVDARGCSNLKIECRNDTCTCSATGIATRTCKDSDCVSTCCPGAE